MDRYIIISDIHGCLDEFIDLLKKVQYNRLNDILLLTGDHVDRGTNSPGVVRYIRFLQKHGKVFALAGNHDDKLIRRWRHMKKARQDLKYKVPMRPSMDQETTINLLTSDELDWISTLPLYHIIEKHKIICLHAGLIPNADIRSQVREAYLMARFVDKTTLKMKSLTTDLKQPENSIHWVEAYNGDYDVVFGHHVFDFEQPAIFRNKNNTCYGIDTGAVFGGKLTAMIIEPGGNRHFEQVRARKAYAPIFTPITI